MHSCRGPGNIIIWVRCLLYRHVDRGVRELRTAPEAVCFALAFIRQSCAYIILLYIIAFCALDVAAAAHWLFLNPHPLEATQQPRSFVKYVRVIITSRPPAKCSSCGTSGGQFNQTVQHRVHLYSRHLPLIRSKTLPAFIIILSTPHD